VPFFRPLLGQGERDAVLRVLDSGWLTTGSEVARFEEAFARAVEAEHAIAVNSATAALHLALEALGLRAGHGVLVPTMTFAATAEVVRYLGAFPILVDCEPGTLNIDLADAAAKCAAAAAGSLLPGLHPLEVVGVMPVHVGGFLIDYPELNAFARSRNVWMVEDAAHAFPAAQRPDQASPWIRCGHDTAAVTCFSFYANKTITTGEGGMAVTANRGLADRMRQMSLHGLSTDAWRRYSGRGSWDYRILAPGFKYNLTDLAAAIGVEQLHRAEAMRVQREAVATRYLTEFAGVEEFELPPVSSDRIHAWHLFPIRLRLDRLTIDRDTFMEELRSAGIGTSVHWRPLHLHPYYTQTFGWREELLPVASREWRRLVSLPIFPSMTCEEGAHVIAQVKRLCAKFASPR
jgi:perosamine synthetase